MKWVALLGRRDAPTDGVEDYCSFLGEALKRNGVDLRQARVPWPEKGWIAALRSLWDESTHWTDAWVLLQYTTMAWSRRGFPFGALAALAILRRRKLRCAVVYHDPSRQNGKRWVDRFRGACQDWIIRRLYARATKAIFLEPLDKIGWLPSRAPKAVFIPIGANFPSTLPEDSVPPSRNGDAKTKTVVVFCLSDAPNRRRELEDIAYAMRLVAQQGIKARVVFVGRGTEKAKEEIDERFDSAAGEAANLGLQPAAQLRRILSEADVMLCVRGPLYMRRGSAIAGIACGLPIVGYAGEAEGTPLEEAGIELAPYLDREALGKALARVLADQHLLLQLRQRSLSAQQLHFSWDRIAAKMLGALQAPAKAAAGMKVVLYSEYFFPISGGVQTQIFELACGLSEWRQAPFDRAPLDVTVVTRTTEKTAEDSSWPFRLVRHPSFARLVRLLHEADVIHLAGPAMLPMALGLVLRRPVVIEHHGYQAICPNGLLLLGTSRTVCPGHFMARRYAECLLCNSGERGFLRSLRDLLFQFPRRWLCKLASANIAITEHVGRRITLPRTHTILYGIRDSGCTRLPPARNGNGAEIGYVGRLVPEKGLPVLLRAAKRLRDDGFFVHVTLVGDGPLRKQLENESCELGLTSAVTFTGELAGAELDRAVRRLQIVVMPSVWEETAGLSAIEQMMRGRVVVAADIGGLSEVVGDAGLKFVPGDSDSLYACLRQLLEEPALGVSLGSAARARAVQCFARDNMIRAHLASYLDVLQH